MKTDIVIVGAGIIGTALAIEVSREGMKVLLLDRQRPVREATWAAAGMLAKVFDPSDPPPMASLERASDDLYPAFVEEIEAKSGIRVGFQRKGTLLAFFGPRGEEERNEHQEAVERRGFACQAMTGDEARRREPLLTPEATAALWLADETSVDNRALGRALTVAAGRGGAVLRGGVEATELVIEAGRCQGVIAGGEKIPAAHVVITAGCYSARIGRAEIYAPTRPIRGQMASLDAAGARPASTIRSNRGYLVPREDGRLIAGSTLEDAGFDKSLTPQGLRRILDGAVQMVPSLASAPIIETWAGLRPDTPDHLPILGPTDIEGLSIATGHYCGGILLAPITARLARQWLLKQKTDLPLEPFSPMRFARSAPAKAGR